MSEVWRDLRSRPRRSARCKVRGVSSDSGCGVTEYGADGPGRRSSSVSRGVVDGTTVDSSPQTAAGHDRMTRPSRRSSSRGAACGFWIRAWGQREPALQGTGRLNRSAQGLGWLKGGLDFPATHAECGSLQREHPLRTLTRRAWSRTGRIGIFASHPIAVSLNDDRLPVMHQPVDQGRGQGVVHVKQGAPFPEGSIRRKHDRSGFITGGDHLEQQIGSALVDGQIAQLIEEEKTGTDVSSQRVAQHALDLGRGEMIDHVHHARMAERNSHARPPCNRAP